MREKFTLYDYTYNCIIKACLSNLENFKTIKNKHKLIIIGLSCVSNIFENYESSFVPILNYSMTITNNIILYPVDKELMNRDEYKHIRHCNNFGEIIQQIKMLLTNSMLSIFVQAEHPLHLCDLVDIIQKTHI